MHPTLIKQFTAARQMRAEINKQKKKIQKIRGITYYFAIGMCKNYGYTSPSIRCSCLRVTQTPLAYFFCLIRAHSQITMCGYYHVTPVWFLSWLLLSVPTIFSVELCHVLILPSGADSYFAVSLMPLACLPTDWFCQQPNTCLSLFYL